MMHGYIKRWIWKIKDFYNFFYTYCTGDKWLFLKIPNEFKTSKDRINCIKQTRKHIIKYTKIKK